METDFVFFNKSSKLEQLSFVCDTQGSFVDFGYFLINRPVMKHPDKWTINVGRETNGNAYKKQRNKCVKNRFKVISSENIALLSQIAYIYLCWCGSFFCFSKQTQNTYSIIFKLPKAPELLLNNDFRAAYTCPIS